MLEHIDPDTGRPLVDVILDEAQQKGTGKWMSQNAFDVGAPIPTVNAAVEARLLSALKAERVVGEPRAGADRRRRSAAIARQLIDAAAAGAVREQDHVVRAGHGAAAAWPRPSTATTSIRARSRAIWRAGCIIRAALLGDIRDAFRARSRARQPAARRGVPRRGGGSGTGGWRHVVQTAIGLGIPVPAMSASLAYYDAYRSARLPANLTQAQRDFFGAHTYRRVDRDGVFHTDWATE